MVKKSVNNLKYSSEDIAAMVAEREENRRKIKDMEGRIAQLDKINKKLKEILDSDKTPYEKKIALFEVIKDLDVGESQPLKEQRVNYLLESRLYDVLSKRALEDYRKTTVKAFSKAKVL
jgi:F0F1-type ATP synthase delta subunit